MTFESMRDVILARPFRPFTLRLADGRTKAVKHPEFVAFVGDKRTLMVSAPGSGFELLDLILVQGIEFGETRRARRRG